MCVAGVQQLQRCAGHHLGPQQLGCAPAHLNQGQAARQPSQGSTLVRYRGTLPTHSYPFWAGLRIRSIFGLIRIQQIRILRTGSRIQLTLTKNQFKHQIFFHISQISSDI